MITRFSPTRFGSGDPSKVSMPGLASNRTQLSQDNIKSDKKLTRDIFTTGGLTEDGVVSPRKINSTQTSQTLRSIIEANKEKKDETKDTL